LSLRAKKAARANYWSLTMTHKLMAAALVVLSLAGTTAAFAQTRNDYYRYNWTGRGQCVTDEGYGRYSSCDGGGGN
jgi:hypothetical protein